MLINEFATKFNLSSVKLESYLKYKNCSLEIPLVMEEILTKIYSTDNRYIFITDSFILIDEILMWKNENVIKTISNKYSQISYLRHELKSNFSPLDNNLKPLDVDHLWFDLFKFLARFDLELSTENKAFEEQLLQLAKIVPDIAWNLFQTFYNNPLLERL